MGFGFDTVPTHQLEEVEKKIQPRTRLLIMETPTNPTMRITDLRALSALCRDRGVTLVVDNTFMTPYFQRPLELGADVVKTAFPTGASVDAFRAIVESCFVPVVVLGGAAMGDDAALLGMVEKAMAAGAAGVAIGRNVWQHGNPAGIARALQAVVHGGEKAESALRLVSDGFQ